MSGNPYGSVAVRDSVVSAAIPAENDGPQTGEAGPRIRRAADVGAVVGMMMLCVASGAAVVMYTRIADGPIVGHREEVGAYLKSEKPPPPPHSNTRWVEYWPSLLDVSAWHSVTAHGSWILVMARRVVGNVVGKFPANTVGVTSIGAEALRNRVREVSISVRKYLAGSLAASERDARGCILALKHSAWTGVKNQASDVSISARRELQRLVWSWVGARMPTKDEDHLRERSQNAPCNKTSTCSH